MNKLFILRQAITGGLESVKSDLELRLQVLKGDSIATELMKGESKEELREILQRHIKNVDNAHQLINEQFNLINEIGKSAKP